MCGILAVDGGQEAAQLANAVETEHPGHVAQAKPRLALGGGVLADIVERGSALGGDDAPALAAIVGERRRRRNDHQ